MEKESLISIKNIFYLALATIGLSVLAWHFSQLVVYILLLIAMAVIYLSTKSPVNGLMIMAFEICIGSLGKLLTINLIPNVNLSLRLVIFLSLILGALMHLIIYKSAQQQLLENLSKFKYWLLIFPLLLIPIIIGLISNSMVLVYTDANGWLFFGLLLPILLIKWSAEKFSGFLKIFIGASLVAILLTAVIYVLYGWNLINYPMFNWIYHWLRQVGWGEVTHVNGNLYRVFSQAHIFILALWTISLTCLVFKYEHILKNRTAEILLYLTSTTLIINLSRSMWVGAGFVFLLLIITQFKKVISNWKKLLVIILLAIITSGLLIGRLGFVNLKTRISQQPSEPAIASRIVQLKPLLNGIQAHWLSGTGFGGQVGYPSEDPRAKQRLDENGLFWTTAFEWGYLDQLLKFGVFVFSGFLFYLLSILYKLLIKKRPETNLLLVVLLSIYATHMFSPYLNHPLGISWIIVAITAITIDNDVI